MPPFENDLDLAKLVAAAVCSGQRKDMIVREFGRRGAEPGRVEELVDEMSRIREMPRPTRSFGLIWAGLAVMVPGLLVTFATGGETIWYGPVVIGFFVSAAGVFRVMNGTPPLRTKEVIEAWLRDDAHGKSRTNG